MRHAYNRTKVQMLYEILRDPDRKPIPVIIREIFILWWHHKELPVHYISRYLFKKDAKNLKDYVPNRLAGQIAPYFNDPRLKQVLDNKLFFNLFYNQFGVVTPEVIAFNHGKLLAFQGAKRVIGSVEMFRNVLLEMFSQNKACDALFLKKMYSSSSGANIHVILRELLDKEYPAIEEIFQSVMSSEYVFQPRIRQHPELNRLNPASLNTIRIDTFIDKDGGIHIISAFIKMSTNNVPVDNGTLGGCGVGIDLDTGKLRTKGYSKIKVSGVGILTEHPVTAVSFKGFTIPLFKEAKELVLKAAELMPGLRLVGWDVGIGESGPILVEGNSDYGINSNDMMYGGYLTNTTFRKVLSEMGRKL